VFSSSQGRNRLAHTGANDADEFYPSPERTSLATAVYYQDPMNTTNELPKHILILTFSQYCCGNWVGSSSRPLETETYPKFFPRSKDAWYSEGTERGMFYQHLRRSNFHALQHATPVLHHLDGVRYRLEESQFTGRSACFFRSACGSTFFCHKYPGQARELYLHSRESTSSTIQSR
jgi:hypothetical protein